MITRTCYFPRNQIGRYVLNYLVERVGCSIGTIRRVADVLAVTITLPVRDISKLEHILQIYDLM